LHALFQLADGNTDDDPAHIPAWDQLVKLTGSPDFLCLADCKLASAEAMRHIDADRGRFITVPSPRRPEPPGELGSDTRPGRGSRPVQL